MKNAANDGFLVPMAPRGACETRRKSKTNFVKRQALKNENVWSFRKRALLVDKEPSPERIKAKRNERIKVTSHGSLLIVPNERGTSATRNLDGGCVNETVGVETLSYEDI